MALREKVTEAMLDHTKIPEGKEFDSRHPFHFKNYADNLFCPLTGDALSAYAEGSGNETKPYMRRGSLCPPKMSSIASSSAMTFNLLGNAPATFLPGTVFPQGTYTVQYEKQMHTVRTGGNPANLDAFLENESNRTAIFCEMKLLEWLGSPGLLKDTYLEESAFFKSEDKKVNHPVNAYTAFQKVIERMIIGSKNADGKYTSIFKRYDAWQMLKHLLAIYNYTSHVTQDSVNSYSTIPSMAGKYNHIILANVVNEFPPQRINDSFVRAKYKEALEEEYFEALQFIKIIQESQIPRLFDNNCGARIEVVYISTKDFANSLDISQAKQDYLKRYFA